LSYGRGWVLKIPEFNDLAI